MFAALSAFEFTLVVEIFSSRLGSLYSAAYSILFSRLAISLVPTLTVFFDLMKRNGSTLKPLLETTHFFLNARTYGVLMIFCLFECNLLVYLPW